MKISIVTHRTWWAKGLGGVSFHSRQGRGTAGPSCHLGAICPLLASWERAERVPAPVGRQATSASRSCPAGRRKQRDRADRSGGPLQGHLDRTWSFPLTSLR